MLLGNHRDAWVFGAADASSGTAAMMELSRALGEQLKKGAVSMCLLWHKTLRFLLINQGTFTIGYFVKSS